MNRLG
jgi:hypothetical protein